MPSVNIPTSDGSGNLLTGVQTLDLYSIYNTGFSAPKIKSAGANNSIPFLKSINSTIMLLTPIHA